LVLPVTYLFVPGNRPERFDKALDAGADAVILDLEDAVAATDKASAREAISRWLATRTDALDRVLLRINDESTSWFAEDVELSGRAHLRRVMLPKTESAAQVDRVRAAMVSQGGVVPLIETARGLNEVERIATAAGVQRLAFGTLDYAVDLDLDGDDRGLIYPATKIAIASRCAGIASPIAGVTAAIDDDERLLADVAFARSVGFTAKLCIHPRQLGVVRNAMAPSKTEVEWARRVVAASEAAGGAVVQVEGRMVDRPVLLRAKGILDRVAR
jgi:citrate lyase subunit beta/citryl-CoA lyase